MLQEECVSKVYSCSRSKGLEHHNLLIMHSRHYDLIYPSFHLHTQEEQSKVLSEVSHLRDQLRAVRGESARRGRALQLLQGIIPSSQQQQQRSLEAGGAVSNGGLEQFEANADDGTKMMDFEAVAKAASSAAAASAKEAEGERSARLAVEAKLKECRQAIERKTSLVRLVKRNTMVITVHLS